MYIMCTFLLLDHKKCTCLLLVDNAQQFSKLVRSIYRVPPTSSVCSTDSTTNGLSTFSLHYSGGCVQVSHFVMKFNTFSCYWPCGYPCFWSVHPSDYYILGLGCIYNQECGVSMCMHI